MAVVFRHVNEFNYVLRYPCCESFINTGFCLKCFPGARQYSGKVLPYLLYVGDYSKTLNLQKMPVCHIDVSEAQRIIKTIWPRQQCFLQVYDIEGESHSFFIYYDVWIHRLLSVLSYYVSMASSTSIVPLPLPPLQMIEQLRWDIHNCAREMMDMTQAMRCRTISGKKRRWNWRSRDSQMCDLYTRVCNILSNVYRLRYEIQDEDEDCIKQISRAFK